MNEKAFAFDEKNMIEALGEALELKNAKIRELARDLGKKVIENRELRGKLMLAEAENLMLRGELRELGYE